MLAFPVLRESQNYSCSTGGGGGRQISFLFIEWRRGREPSQSLGVQKGGDCCALPLCKARDSDERACLALYPKSYQRTLTMYFVTQHTTNEMANSTHIKSTRRRRGTQVAHRASRLSDVKPAHVHDAGLHGVTCLTSRLTKLFLEPPTCHALGPLDGEPHCAA